MELLIYNKSHWMDALTVEEVTNMAKANEHFQAKYDALYQKGDIVEVREDGYWTEQHGYDKSSFAVVEVDKVPVDESLMKAQEDVTDPENPVLLKRRQYSVDTTKVAFVDEKAAVTKIDDAEITDKVTDTKVTTEAPKG